jgi:hypothetical protein
MKSTALLLALMCMAASADAKQITSCGASKGYSFNFEGPIVPRDKAGWIEDGISSGGLVLLLNGDEFDIVITDSLGSKSMRADGFQVFNIPQPRAGSMILGAIADSW